MTEFLRYADGVETPLPNEAETIAGIIDAMSTESRKVAERDGETVRASHAKSTGLLKGTMDVPADLPEPYRQGLFARPGTFPVIVRLAQGPGEKLSDSVSTHRGMAIKVFGVSGEKLPGHAADTQDFVLATGTNFPQGTAAGFLTAIKGLGNSVNAPQGLKAAVTAVTGAANAVLNAVGADSANLGFFGHTKRNPLSDAYFSQAALRFGNHVAKLGVFPVSPELIALIDKTLDTGADPDAFRHSVVEFMASHDARFELRAQLCTDLDAMPVEDASVPWPQDRSPYRTVATITLPRQDAYSAARQAYFDQVLSFRPQHSLAAHRPLGSLMRARLATYPALSTFRHGRNHRTEVEPSAIDQVPD